MYDVRGLRNFDENYYDHEMHIYEDGLYTGNLRWIRN